MRSFMPFGDDRACKVVKDDIHTLEMSPAEIDKATYIVGIALSMQSMDPLPSHIKGSPFVVQFLEDDTLRLERRSESGSIPFTWGEGDDLIVALNDAKAMAINERTLVHAPRGAHQGSLNDEAF